MSKSSGILRICEEKGIKMIDFKMTDLSGRWRHITIPVERFDDGIFTQGIGFDGSNYGYAPVEKSDMVFIPNPETAVVDPFTEIPTLIMCGDVCVIGKENKPFDQYPRNVSLRAIQYMKEQGSLVNNTIVTTIMSNFGLYKALDREGIAYEKTAVGDKYVYENMSANGHCLGGEQSGHIIFSKNATTGDGILTSLKVMEAMLEKKQSLGKLASEVEIFPQVLKNVKVKDKKAAQDDAAVQAEVAKVTESLGDDGRILLRQSGTEPVVRVMVEAPSLEICEKYVDQVIQVMKTQGHVL